MLRHCSLPIFVLSIASAYAQDTAPALPTDADTAVLLITAPELAEAWRPFATWKTRLGKPTRIVTVAEIRERYQADTVQEQIRLCVRDHIDRRGTRWVVLGGDCLPDGAGLVPGGHTTVHRQEPSGIPTDIVYLSPTDWDADDDEIHGEWKDDRGAISYPDGEVGLGRIPVRTPADVAAFTAKVIAYESEYPADGFARRMIYTCTDAPAYPKVRNSWDGHVSNVWSGDVERFFAAETPWDGDEPGSHELSSDNLVALINGRTTGKLHIHGHGMLPFWVLEQGRFTGKDVERLDHPGAYPLITTVSCFTGQYDAEQDPSIVESMLRQPDGGSVAIVAPVRSGKPHFHKRSDFRLMIREGKLDGTTWTMTKYWSGGLGKGQTTGESLMRAKAAMADDARRTAGYHLCICELNLLGDPTLDMRAVDPVRPTLSAPERLSLGAHSVEVTTGTPGATVCLSKGVELYATGLADESGSVTFEVELTTPGIVHVTVAGSGVNVTSCAIEVVADSE